MDPWLDIFSDQRWLDFLPKIQVLIETMDNKILKPSAFSPLA